MESGAAGSVSGQSVNTSTFQSPALAASIQGSADAYEMKCLLDEATASALEDLLSS